ncbi:hypothetical protein RDI58_030184 [Solanum bulbocastanum]|uniref:Uncharacterized protein n=1 Tax=Solanum bulbocastanum TaxID=147425 RepID=A0AAN8SV67_SOLBU
MDGTVAAMVFLVPYYCAVRRGYYQSIDGSSYV